MKAFMIASRIIKQIMGDKRTLGILIGAPIFITCIIYFVLTSAVSKPSIDIVGDKNNNYKILEEKANITYIKNEQEAIDKLKKQQSDAYLYQDGNTSTLVLEGTEPSIVGLVKSVYMQYQMEKIVNQTEENMQNIQQKLENVPLQIKEHLNIKLTKNKEQSNEIKNYYREETLELFDFIAPNLMGTIIFFLVFISSGISFLRERISGTLEKTMATSIRRGHIVLGYFLGFGFFAIIQTVIIQILLINILKINVVNNFFLVLLINLVIAGSSLALGTLLSAFARNEFQLIQFIPIVIIPQILFSGMFNLREAPAFIIYLSKIFPLTYAADALRDIMIRGKGIDSVYQDILIILAFMIIFILLNVRVLKKYRRA